MSSAPVMREVFGPYVLVERIAVGGMGEVFLAARADAGRGARPVALKRAPEHVGADHAFSRALVDEARITAQLKHPSIVPVLDAGEVGGRFYLAMEFVHGPALGTVLEAVEARGDAVPAAIACAIMAPVLRALDHAHARTDAAGESLGIIHRDVTPQNILVGWDGAARLSDFGIARARVRAAQTTTGVVKGKMAYVAPEQLQGGTVDARVDVFSAAAVLWELLEGRPLRRANSEAELLGQVMRGDVPPMTRTQEAHPALADVVMRGIHADPAQRFASASALLDALVQAVKPAPSPEVAAWLAALLPAQRERDAARVSSWGSALARPAQVRRSRWQGPVALGVAAVGVAALAFFTVRAVQPSRSAVTVVASPAAAPVTTPPPPAAPEPPPPPARSPTVEARAPAPRPLMSPVASAPPHARTGVVSLQSRPWGRIWVDGQDTGRFTPVEKLELPAGPHRVRLVNPELGVSDEFELHVQGGSAQRVSRTLR